MVNMTDSSQPPEGLPKHGVERLILLDSYLPRRKAELVLDGHTALTGNNSTGKTSLIRLLPAFFGAEPKDLVRRDRNSKMLRFTDYYLPNRGSYVVFEYRTHVGLNLSVLTTAGNTDSLRLTLISGAYEDGLFLDDQDRFLDKAGLRDRARAEGREVFTCRSISEYRQIVLGNGAARGREYRRRRFNVFEGYLQGNRCSMEHVHPILSSTVDADVSIDERLLRKLLFDQALRRADVTDASTLTSININVDSLQEWVYNSEGLEALRARIPDALESLESASKYRSLGTEEAILRAAVERRLEHTKARQQDQRMTCDESSERIQALDEAYEKARSRYTAQREHHQGRLIEAKQNIEALNARKNEQINSGIHEALSLAERASSFEAAFNTARETLSVLTSKSADIDQAIDGHIDRVKDGAEKELEAIAERERAAHARARTETRQLLRRQDDQRKAFQAQTEQEKQSLDEALRTAQSELAVAEKSFKTVDADPVLIDKRDVQQQKVDRARDQKEACTDQRQKAKSELDTALNDRDRLMRQEQACRGLLEQRKNEHAALSDQLQRTGTVLEYVRDHVPDWESSIGAVLNAGTALLYESASKLKPEPASDPAHSLFGIAIETSALKRAEVDRQERERLEALDKEVDELGRELADFASESRTLNAVIQSARKAFDEAERELSKAASRVSACRDALHSLNQQVEESRGQRRVEAEKALAQAQQVFDQAQAAQTTYVDERVRLSREMEDRHSAESQALEEAIDQDIQRLGQARVQAQDTREASIAELESARAQRRAEAGVSEADIAVAKEKVAQAEADHERAQEAVSRKNAWEHLLREIEQRMPGFEQTVSDAEGEIQTLDKEWSAFETTNREEARSVRQHFEQAERALNELSRDRTRLEGLLDLEELLGDPEALDETTVDARASLDVAVLDHDMRGVRTRLQTHRKALIGKLQGIEKLLSRSRSAMCLKFAEQEGLKAKIGGDGGHDLLSAANAIERFFGSPTQWTRPDGPFPQDTYGEALESAVRGGSNYHIELDGFVYGLEAISKEIAGQTRAVRAHFDAMLRHVSSIDRIDVETTFDLNQIDGYAAASRALKAIQDHERRQAQTGDRALVPGREVRQAFEELIRYLSSRTYEKKVDLVDAVGMRFTVERLGGQHITRSSHGQSLKSAFSTGIRTIVSVVVLVAFLESMRQELPITTPCVLDELLRLDEGNTRGLLKAMEQQRIFLMTTSPSVKPEIDACFSRRYVLQDVGSKGERLSAPVLVEFTGESAWEPNPFDVLDEAETNSSPQAPEEIE